MLPGSYPQIAAKIFKDFDRQNHSSKNSALKKHNKYTK